MDVIFWLTLNSYLAHIALVFIIWRENMLQIGQKAPEFKLMDSDRKERTLNDWAGRNVILAFIPAAFTGVCTKEMCTFRSDFNELEDLNSTVVMISVDAPFSNQAFAAQNELNFTLLSDYTREVSKNYGGVHQDFAGMKGYEASKRAVYILDKNRTVTYAWVTDNPGNEPDYSEIKKVLSSL